MTQLRAPAGGVMALGLALLGFATTAAAQPAPGPVITEFKAINEGPLRDELGYFSDWIELHNPTEMTLNLEGWFLTDQQSNLRLWSFPATNLEAGAFMILFASGRNQRTPGSPLHTSFGLRGGGEYLALVRPDGTNVAQEFAPFPPQLSQFSYGFHMMDGRIDRTAPVYLPATPGQTNPPARAALPLALTELMYHPAPTPLGSPADADAFEFIELKNTGTNAINLAGVTFVAGVGFTFDAEVLAPDARLLLVEDTAAFFSRYGPAPVAGQYRGDLPDSSGRLTLLGPDGSVIFDFTYSDEWARASDGLGYSLVPVHEDAPAATYGSSTAWRASAQRDGSPGRPDPPPAPPSVVINEVLTRSAAPYEDAIELFNPTTNDVDLTGWFLTDSFNQPRRYRLPAGALVPAGGFLALDEHAFNPANDDPTRPGFGLSDFGEEIYLLAADAAGEFTGWVHGFRYPAAEVNVPFGRHLLSTGEEHFVPQADLTFLATNRGPKVGPVVISEIHYHPAGPAGQDNGEDEFIKLLNITDDPVPLFDPLHPTNTWRLTAGGFLLFEFPEGAVLPPRGYAVVLRINPAQESALQQFTSRIPLAPGALLFGPCDNLLDNLASTVELVRPDPPELFFTPYLAVDRIQYRAFAPWPDTANGTGASIHRIDNAAYGNDPTNWWAATPAPGRRGDAPPVFLRQPADQGVGFGAPASLHALAVGLTPISYQWRLHGSNIPGATEPTLTLPAVLPKHEGDYTCLASNTAHTALSRTARLRIHDDTPPTLFIPGASEQRLTTATRIHGGTVSDDAIVAGVFARLNGGPDRRADGLASWTLPVQLQPGFNFLVTYAVDWRGNRSEEITNVFLLEPRSARLGLRVVGSGTVSGGVHGQVLEAGRNYTLQATPHPGHRFRHWLDWNSGMTQTNRILRFTGGPERTFTATFEPGPFVTVAGAYNGLFHNATNPAHLDAGFLSIQVTSRGSFSGILLARGRRLSFSGALDTNFSANLSLRLSATNTLRLALVLDPESLTVVGRITENRFVADVFARRQGFAADSPLAGSAGHYTATLTATADPGPARQRGGTAVIGPTGRLRFSGRLPDGTTVAREVQAGEDGLAPLYLAAYDGRGSVFGWLSLTNIGTNTLRGALLWNRTGRNAFTNGIDFRAHR